MSFKELLLRAKENDEYATTTILTMYKPLLLRESIVDGVFDEDLFQELCLTVIKCIYKIIA